jgi:GNAT superfamily N-acetyltransferase
MKIQFAQTKEDYLKCLEAMQALRPHLTAESFLDLTEKMKAENYSLIYIEENQKAMAVCGFRYVTNLFEGKHIYIDDLSTLPEARGKGYAGALFDFVVENAKSEGLPAIHLDSGYQRHDAHRLYLNKKMKIVFHHFRLELK